MANMSEMHEKKMERLMAAREIASETKDERPLEELTEEARAQREQEEEQRAKEREVYGEVLDGVREAAKRERVLRRVNEGGEEHEAALSRLEKILEELPDDWAENAETRIDYDELREDIEHYTALIRDRWESGNPFRLVERTARRAEEIGFAKYADQAALDEINSKEFKGQWLGVRNVEGNWVEAILPERPNSTMSRRLFDALHQLRMTASAETSRYAEQQKEREQMIADMNVTSSDVQAVVDGLDGTVAGFFPWRSRGRHITGFICARGTAEGIEILDSDVFSNLVEEGSVIDESHKARGAVVAALLQLKSKLVDEEDNSGPVNHLQERRKRQARELHESTDSVVAEFAEDE